MREIKFRGKRLDNGEWVYGLPVNYCNKTYILVLTDFEEERVYEQYPHKEMWPYEVIPETVGQFTGLKDKNEVEIYEGDIVRVLNNYKEYEDGEVAMSNLGLWAVRLRGLKVPLCEFIDNRLSIVHSTERIEVIGNIYEHRHLLEVE